MSAPDPTAQSAVPPTEDPPDLVIDTSDAQSDTDSAFGGGGSSASTSLASSVLNYEYSNGRRYSGYRSGSYVLPNDEEEQDRLDLFHHVFLMMLDGKLYEAPVPASSFKRVLDLGTGTGIWALDIADENPGCEVIGTDLSPIQPTWVPPNCKFYVDDAEAEWVYNPADCFDFIHIRGLSGSIGDWDKLVRQSFEHMAPGGYVEFQEADAQVRSDDDTSRRAESIDQWQKLGLDAARIAQRDMCVAPTLKEKMAAAGFVDIHEKILKIPVGPWAKDPKMKEIGRYMRELMVMGVEPYTYGFIGKLLGWSQEECRVLIAKTTAEVRDKKFHLYNRFYFVYGRKPEAAH